MLRTFPVPEMEKAFRQGLQELGYVEGRNIVIEPRYWNGNADRLAEVTATLAGGHDITLHATA